MRENTLPKTVPPAARAASLVARHLAGGWAAWLFPQSFTVVASVLYLGTLILFFYDRLRATYSHPLIAWQAIVLSGAIGGLLLLDRVEYRRYGATPPAREATALLLVRIVLIEIVAQLDDFSFSPFLYLLIPFTASLYFGRRVSYGLAVGVWIVFLVKFSWYQPTWYADTDARHLALLFSVGLVFAMAMAAALRNVQASRTRTEQLLRELEQSHQQLQAYTAQVGELATVQERNRLAREIHDSLGHYLTVINVQLEKAHAFRPTRPEEAEQAVQDAKRLAGEALREVRRSVSVLRTTRAPDAVPLRAALATLVEHWHDSPFTVSLRVSGSEEGYSPQALEALYRAAQEGLTNVQKHAGATHVAVTLDLGSERACLTVRDEGRGFDSLRRSPGGTADPEGGYGLLGLQERLALVGGRIQITSAVGVGTTLQACVARPEGACPTGDGAPAPAGDPHG